MHYLRRTFCLFWRIRKGNRQIGRHVLERRLGLNLIIILLLTAAFTNTDSKKPVKTPAQTGDVDAIPSPSSASQLPDADAIFPPDLPQVLADPDSQDEVLLLQRMLSHSDSTERWKALSLLTTHLWSSDDFEHLNSILDEMLETEQTPDLVAQIHLVRAHNDLILEQPENALARLESIDLLQDQGETRYWDALRLQAHAQLAADDLAAAAETFDRLVQELPDGEMLVDTNYQFAVLLIKLGNAERAQQLLEANLESEFDIAPYLLEASEHPLFQLVQEPGPAFEDLESLVDELGDAFGAEDAERLTDLLDGSQFVSGVLGGHSTPHDSLWLDSIYTHSVDTGRSPRMPKQPIQIEGDSPGELFVLSYDWNLEGVWSDAWLQLSLEEDGWRWTGMWFVPQQAEQSGPRTEQKDLHHPSYALESILAVSARDTTAAAVPPPDLQPLQFELPAPWAAGYSMLGGTWFLGNPSPVVDGKCADFVGWPGQYYGQGNHGVTYDEYYAIDFLKWGTRLGVCPIPWPPFVAPCIWPWPSSGTPVASVSQGRVISVRSAYSEVVVEHLDDQGRATGYRSTYMHMQPVFVLKGQYVARGTLLGLVGAQGTAEAHLHFHLELDVDPSNSTKYEPAMPSPLEGITLDLSGARHCIYSSNSNTYYDKDSDGVYDIFDNCPSMYNPYQMNTSGMLYQPDTDGDGWGDACACSSDTDCEGTNFCDRSKQPPKCTRPLCDREWIRSRAYEIS